MKKIRNGLLAAVLLAGCTRPDTGPLSAPEFTNTISGVTACFDDGTVILITETAGPVILSGTMDFSGLQSGNHLTVYCDDITETFPAQTEVKEMVLHEKGDIADLPAEEMEKLISLGYELSGYAPSYIYTSISMKEAAEIFAAEGEYIILDVRRADEYASGHIPGAINIANEDISDTPFEELKAMDTVIYVYCRSGNRSRQAAEKLSRMGYSNIIECGGIMDWTGETVSE